MNSRALLLSTQRAMRQLTAVRSTYRQFHQNAIARQSFKNIDKATLEDLTQTSSKDGRLLLLDFYADWCKPCHMLSPTLEKLSNDPQVKTGTGLPIDLATIDTESNDGFGLSVDYQIRAMPTVVALRDGKEVNRFVGALAESSVRDFLQKV